MSRLTDRLKEQLKKTGVKQVDLARELGITQQAINNLLNGRSQSSAYWREIARILDIPEEEMRELMIEAGRDPQRNTTLPVNLRILRGITGNIEAPESGEAGDLPAPNAIIGDNKLPQPPANRMIPVLGEAVGGDDGEYLFNGSVLDYMPCPPSLYNVPHAYCVFVDGESMSPRYKSGETVYVHPSKPARRGDDVIVQIKAREEGASPRGFIKEMVGWSGSKLILMQHNPSRRIEFDRDEVVSVHPIILSGKYT
ncbi:LexA family transcriptional regulator [Limoniibacter endophyticus]|uniref:HTH cro/C1-type domain-containing protein n=1 Tax=Limoniibacter endophyticus TaxID=1565040 RepID=A0A8J3DNR5_9HYPH|nr:XRE family transcriptional regulator [Limoniibacter endophyticus]GHC61307.1 hypothetical protein GCM10010136_01780 [Limoniibacter endophyticus]